MSESPWIKFYASDWLAGTSGLTAAERGVYITILALIYETGGPVRLDRSRLARRCGVPAGSFVRILEGLLDEGKLIETEAGLTNRRAEHEIGERENLRTKHQSGAQKTNAIRAEKTKEKQQEDERSAQRTADAYQKPESYSVETDVSTGAEAPPDVDPAKVVFDSGRRILAAAGVPKDKAGKLLGKWRRDHGDDALIAALGRCQREGAIDPVSFIAGCLKFAKAKRKPQDGDVRFTDDGRKFVYHPFDGWMREYA